MRFDGRVYFDFSSLDTWHLYRFLAAAAERGAELALSWVPFLAGEDGDEMLALSAFAAVKAADPARHGAFLQAVLTLHHREGFALGPDLFAAGADVAGVDRTAVDDASAHEDAVAAATAAGRALGVAAVPTLYRHGPVLHVRLNPAALDGDVLGRLAAIDAVLGDDGIWALTKP